MEQGRKFLRIAALADIIYGLAIFNVSIFSIGLLVLGFILFSLSYQEDILESKVFLIVTAIASFLFNVVAGVFTFMCLNELDKERTYKETQDSGGETKKEEIDPESKKIDLLLKLGVGMVFVSGILFATTSWAVITDMIKLVTLLLLGTAFLGLSIFTEKKLNIKRTSIMYWFLSMSFYFAIIVGIGYFGLLGEALSYHGDYKEIMYGITIFFLAIITAISYLKYNHDSLLYLTYLFVFTGIYYMLIGLQLPEEVIYLIFVSISLVINVITNKETTINRFNTILSYYFAFKMVSLFGSEFKTIVTILTLLNMANITYLSKRTDSMPLSILTVLCDYILIYVAILIHSFAYPTIIIMVLTTIISSLVRYNVLYKYKETNTINNCIYLASTLLLFCASFTLNSVNVLLVSTIYLAYILVNRYVNNNDIVDKYLLPIAMFFEAIALGYFVNNISELFEIGYNYVFLVLTLVYTLVYVYIKEEERMIYLITIILSTGLTTLINLIDQDSFVQLMTLVPIVCLFVRNINNNEQSINKILYIGILADISIAILFFDLTGVGILNSIIVLLIYVILLYVFHHNESFTKINNFAIIVPLIYAIESMDYEYIYKRVLINILEFYALYLIIKYLCYSKSDRDFLCIFGTVFILSQVFFNNEWIVGIYVGVMGILLIFAGFYLKEYEKLFIMGILITVANIVYQLRQLWSQIPFYLYLLIGGLGIIAFVTYKELKNQKKK